MMHMGNLTATLHLVVLHFLRQLKGLCVKLQATEETSPDAGLGPKATSRPSLEKLRCSLLKRCPALG